MKCPYCGNEHPEAAKFCPISGKSLESAKIPCPNCGHEVDINRKFCTACGENLSQTREGMVPVTPPPSRGEIKEFVPDNRGRSNLLYLFIGLLILGVVLIAGGIYYVYRPSSDIEKPRQEVAQITDTDTVTQLPTPTFTSTLEPNLVIDEPETNTPLVPTATEEIIITNTTSPYPSETPVPTPTKTAEPENQPISMEINPVDEAEYVLVPAGEFLMGSEPGKDPFFWGAEGPEHTVYLDKYWIYRTEVTNEMYQLCVEDQKCPRPQYLYSVDAEDYYGNPEYDDYPVIHVTFTHAQSYCNWAGGKLPSEAQWEKAARGSEGYMFPWGDDPPDVDLVNLCDSSCARGSERENHFSDGYPGTSPVGSFPNGASPYGALDMAGNVWEWTFDYFQSTYYSISPNENPKGPATGTTRTIRGGSWFNPTSGVRAAARTSLTPQKILDTLGFRCVVSNP